MTRDELIEKLKEMPNSLVLKTKPIDGDGRIEVIPIGNITQDKGCTHNGVPVILIN
jgi:hypothetical protein